ncbi:MAG: GAF domain-containing protein, partial [Gemmatimonadaceae bacterium]
MHDTPPTPTGSRTRRDAAGQIDLLHRIASQLAERSTSAEVEVDVTNELHAVFQAPWVALYRSQPDGSFKRSALTGNGANAPPEQVDEDSVKFQSSVGIPVALAAAENWFGRQALIAPISHHGEQIGVVVLGSGATAEPFDFHDARFLDLVVRIVAPHLFYLDAREGDK